MEIICAWCEKIIGVKHFETADTRIPLVTHSICKSCREKLFQDTPFQSLPARKIVKRSIKDSPMSP